MVRPPVVTFDCTEASLRTVTAPDVSSDLPQSFLPAVPLKYIATDSLGIVTAAAEVSSDPPPRKKVKRVIPAIPDSGNGLRAPVTVTSAERTRPSSSKAKLSKEQRFDLQEAKLAEKELRGKREAAVREYRQKWLADENEQIRLRVERLERQTTASIQRANEYETDYKELGKCLKYLEDVQRQNMVTNFEYSLGK